MLNSSIMNNISFQSTTGNTNLKEVSSVCKSEVIKNEFSSLLSAFDVRSTSACFESYLERKPIISCEYIDSSITSSLLIHTEKTLTKKIVSTVEYPVFTKNTLKRQISEIDNIDTIHPPKKLRIGEYELEFIYLKTRGSADRIRLLLSYSGLCCKITEYDYQEYIEKYQSIKVPIPILKINPNQYIIYHSNPIYQYLSKISNLDGNNEVESSEISNINYDCDFVLHEYWKLEEINEDITISAVKKQQKKYQFYKQFILPFINKIVDILKNKEYLISNKITSADISVYSLIDTIVKLFPDILRKFERVNDYMMKICIMNGIKECIRY